ncbi:response regulator transcription factor [Paenibacillus koleovorans]|uniref:response regulator transcription factor n=1 Tax=Paenibacillus koleovorans TaxID=121608 RepID=UPI001C3FEE4F|nr:response regulator transcription factor [Paenibacillus koleovorans]
MSSVGGGTTGPAAGVATGAATGAASGTAAGAVAGTSAGAGNAERAGKVFLLEDEESIRSFVVINLKRNGYEVIEAENGDDAWSALERDASIDIALLDVMVPGIDGFEVCRRLRAVNETIGIIFLTARVQEQDKVMGLSLGADDHIAKPFSPAELMARVQSLLRRVRLLKQAVGAGGFGQDEKVLCGPFELHPHTNQLFKQGVRIELTPTEFSLIRYLIGKRNVPISRDQLLDEVWGVNYVGDPKIVDVNIRRVRQKVEDDPSHPLFVEAIWGFGYMWKEQPV